MDSKKMNSPRKRIRKYHTRKGPIINSYMDMAEARREIVHALELHRSSSSSSSFSNPMNYAVSGQRVNSQQFYYSIVESMPIPQPTWSTTAPAIHTAPPPLLLPPSPPPSSFAGEVPEFDWWIGFLKSLDGKKSTSRQRYLPLEEDILMENSKVLSHLHDGLKNEPPNCIGANDDPSYQFPDEWLIIPTADDDHVLEFI